MINLSKLKYRIITNWYGIEEFIQLKRPLPEIINMLDASHDSTSLATNLISLDIWYVIVTCNENGAAWNPLRMSLSAFIKLEQSAIADIKSNMQYDKSNILKWAHNSSV